MPSSSLIVRQKLFEQVAKLLENDILAGDFGPGEYLPPERELQARFGVGRPAIREALITLQRSGLVEIGNGVPARVASPSVELVVENMRPSVQRFLAGPDGQRALQGVRLFTEVGLVRHAALFASDEDRAELTAALAENAKAVGDVEEFIRTDVQFHYVLAKTMKNTAFLAMHDAMSDWLSEQRHVALRDDGESARSFAAHQRIHAAILDRDPDAAEQAMRDHLESGYSAYWRHHDQRDD